MCELWLGAQLRLRIKNIGHRVGPRSVRTAHRNLASPLNFAYTLPTCLPWYKASRRLVTAEADYEEMGLVDRSP